MATKASDPASQPRETAGEGSGGSLSPAEAEIAYLRVVVAECTTIQVALENIKKAAIQRLQAASPRDTISG